MGAMSSATKLQGFFNTLISKMGGATEVHVGFLEGSTAGWVGPRPKKPGKTWKKTEKPSSSISNPPAAYIAWVMEYGDPTHNIPARPFFSTMINKNKSAYPDLIAAAMRMHHYDSRKAFETVGLRVKEDLQQSIRDFPHLGTEAEKRTAERKGFYTPLIDSHNMINSIEYVVL
jgi:hypothetical protein